MLKRLRRLQNTKDTHNGTHFNSRPFAHLVNNSHDTDGPNKHLLDDSILMSPPRAPVSPPRHEGGDASDGETGASVRKRPRMDCGESPLKANSSLPLSETSNSSWAELEAYVIGSVQIFPPTHSTRQMLILRYLTPMGEYQEFLSHVFEQRALDIILGNYNKIWVGQ